MKKTSILLCLGMAMLISVFTACNKTKHSGYQQTESGLYYKFITQNEGETPQVGDIVNIEFAYYLQDTLGHDSMMFSSRRVLQPFNDKIHESLFVGDYYEGLRLMHKGDSMSMYVNVDSVYLKMFSRPEQIVPVPEFVNKDADMRWEVKLIDFCSEEEFMMRKEQEKQEKIAAAQKTFEDYLAENGITTEPTESGLVYVCTQKGKGNNPVANDTVYVHYKGMLLDGTEFDSSYGRGEPISFPLGQHYVIPGWDEGIALMSKGEKGLLYIPQSLAYGEYSPSPSIPPFSNLVFEVELVDIK